MAHPCDTGMCNNSGCVDCLPQVSFIDHYLATRHPYTPKPTPSQEPVIGQELADFLEEVFENGSEKE